MRYYRLVSDCGWGDKSWYERMVPEDEVLAKFNDFSRRDCETIEQAEDSDMTYYIEEDDPEDEEDWDWQDS
jgi:hypothetical protein